MAETLAREDYFGVALDLLAEGGPPAVTIAALCQRLGVTKGSFYHHFPNGPAFQVALLDHWEQAFGHGMADYAVRVADPGPRITLLVQLAVDLHHEAETAIRALARTDAHAAAVQARVDARRVAVVAETLAAVGIPADRAERLAQTGVAILVGTQQMERPVDRDGLRARLDEFQEWVVSLIPAA